ncbi:hypothetical protein J7T55_015577 [Diaporthe amygdali]|uniref:uncharacterized protein n=1 Tax=Phomopsis amygdali TaxID=1214568 RepID=UPI0022FEED2E|nr:uncharacterized protein J7T55_015577 [Diaporthe amygdali]KAJ0120842.1 hypothetical protein J7T55_015577 [Diaporthe amygdali]
MLCLDLGALQWLDRGAHLETAHLDGAPSHWSSCHDIVPPSGPASSSASTTENNKALTAYRLEVFLQEPLREGNIFVSLADQTADFKTNRCQKQMAMNEKLQLIDQHLKQ